MWPFTVALLSILLFFVHFSLFKFKVSHKGGQFKCYQLMKYQRCKSYIPPTTITVFEPSDNRNQNNPIVGNINSSYRYICNNIDSDSFDKNITNYVSTMIITSNNINGNSNIYSDNYNKKKSTSELTATVTMAMKKIMATKISHYLKVWNKVPCIQYLTQSGAV